MTSKLRAMAVEVDVLRIREHPDNIRTRLTGIERLARSIGKYGIQVPLVAHQKYKREAGKQDLELIYGHRRLAASAVAGLKTVPCEIRPFMTDVEILLLMLSEKDREAPDAAGVARGVVRLRALGLSDIDIAERLCTSQAQVRSWARGDGDIEQVELPGPDVKVWTKPVTRRKPASHRAPLVSVSRLHPLIHEYDAGKLDAETVVARVRGLLGGWGPPTTTNNGDAR